jgi:hypothetical protein
MSAPAKPRVRIDREGWIRWDGGERPVDKQQLVEVRSRCGLVSTIEPASWWFWGRHDSKKPFDITHFRIVGEPA